MRLGLPGHPNSTRIGVSGPDRALRYAVSLNLIRGQRSGWIILSQGDFLDSFPRRAAAKVWVRMAESFESFIWPTLERRNEPLGEDSVVERFSWKDPGLGCDSGFGTRHYGSTLPIMDTPLV